MSGRDWCGRPWCAGPSVRGRTLFVRWCRGETGAEDRGAQGRAFEVGLCLSGDIGEGLVRRPVVRRAERSRSDFICPVMSGRDWCGGPWLSGPSVRGRTFQYQHTQSLVDAYNWPPSLDGGSPSFSPFLTSVRTVVTLLAGPLPLSLYTSTLTSYSVASAKELNSCDVAGPRSVFW